MAFVPFDKYQLPEQVGEKTSLSKGWSFQTNVGSVSSLRTGVELADSSSRLFGVSATASALAASRQRRYYDQRRSNKIAPSVPDGLSSARSERSRTRRCRKFSPRRASARSGYLLKTACRVVWRWLLSLRQVLTLSAPSKHVPTAPFPAESDCFELGDVWAEVGAGSSGGL